MTHTCRYCGYQWRARPSRLEMGRTRPARCPRCQRQDPVKESKRKEA